MTNDNLFDLVVEFRFASERLRDLHYGHAGRVYDTGRTEVAYAKSVVTLFTVEKRLHELGFPHVAITLRLEHELFIALALIGCPVADLKVIRRRVRARTRRHIGETLPSQTD